MLFVVDTLYTVLYGIVVDPNDVSIKQQHSSIVSNCVNKHFTLFCILEVSIFLYMLNTSSISTKGNNSKQLSDQKN